MTEKVIYLGEHEGAPIVTFTGDRELMNNPPAEPHVELLARGLAETAELDPVAIGRSAKPQPVLRPGHREELKALDIANYLQSARSVGDIYARETLWRISLDAVREVNAARQTDQRRGQSTVTFGIG